MNDSIRCLKWKNEWNRMMRQRKEKEIPKQERHTKVKLKHPKLDNYTKLIRNENENENEKICSVS